MRAADIVVALDAGAPERDALQAALPRLAPLLDGGGGPRCGLFVASPDAGSRTALRFWADARRTGVALANPEHFPWCLANAPCGAIARAFGITGPTTTWLGGDEALAAAQRAARQALDDGRLDTAVVVGLDIAAARLAAWRLP